MKADPLGDKVKAYEDVGNLRSFKSDAFLLARVDGRAFHTFTKGAKKPVDMWLLTAMIEATKAVSADLHPRLAYVQSDEATFCWHFASPEAGALPFGGREQKLCSVIAAAFTGAFITALIETDPQRYRERGIVPAFDCRVWEVPTVDDQRDAFAWREKDAIKNAVSTAACTIATPKELESLKHNERINLMLQRGFDWEALPQEYKRGAYVRRIARQMTLEPDVLERIPMSKRPPPGSLVTRHSVEVDLKLKTIESVYNWYDVLAHGAEPQLF